MSLITLANAEYHIGANDILRGVDLTVTPETRMGIVGPNGSGKTTMLRMIYGDIEPSAGHLFRMPKLRVGYLEQIKDYDGSLRDVVMSRSPLWEISQRLRELEDEGQTGEEYVHLMGEWEHKGGYDLKRKAEEILMGLGFHQDVFDRSASKLSGGERERAFIGQLLLTEPDLYLMDEPTNNLDYDGLVYLAEFLKNGKTPFLVISHDRYFLDMVTKETAVMERGRIRVFTGNFTSTLRDRQQLRERMYKEWKAQREEISRQKDFIARNIAGQKTKLAQARRKQLEKTELLEKPMKEQVLNFNLKSDIRGGDDVLRFRDLKISIGDMNLIQKTTRLVSRGDRIGIFGPNGSGKTTLFRQIIKSYKRFRNGERDVDIRWGTSIDLGYFEQGHDDIDPQKSPFDVVHDYRPAMNEVEIRSLLAIFGIRGEDAFRAVGNFSGGERTKLSIIILLLTRANLLLLDEPTNHLDITSMSAFEETLRQYDGTIIIVSHDRYFLRNVVNKIWALEDKQLNVYEGSIDFYLEKRLERKKRRDSALSVDTKTNKTPKIAKVESPKKPSPSRLRHKLEKLEKQICKTETEMEKVSELLGFPEVASNPARCKSLMDDHTRLEKDLTELMSNWEDVAYEMEKYT